MKPGLKKHFRKIVACRFTIGKAEYAMPTLPEGTDTGTKKSENPFEKPYLLDS